MQKISHQAAKTSHRTAVPQAKPAFTTNPLQAIQRQPGTNPIQPPKQQVGHNPLRVVQRVLTNKNDILIDQIKWQIMQGFYAVNKKKNKPQENIDYVALLNGAGLLDQQAIASDFGQKPGQNQDLYYQKQKNTGLQLITYNNLMQKNLLTDGIDLAARNANWKSYKSKLDDNRQVQGLGGTDDQNKQVQSLVKWEPAKNKEGVKMTAMILGPDHKLGTTPSGKDVGRASALTTLEAPYVAGHLLNDHLGGPGEDARNIAAIPKDVNTEQSNKVEENVKKRVNEKHEIVFYDVEITYKDDTSLQEPYASNIRSRFGSYKQNTDFSKLYKQASTNPPTAHLDDYFEHNLPIKSITDYRQNHHGYKLSSIKTGYYKNDLNKRVHREPKEITSGINSTGTRARLQVNKEKQILLKDEKQVKLELIAYAIYSIPINELTQELKIAQITASGHTQQINTQNSKIQQLEKTLKTNQVLLEQLYQSMVAVEKELLLSISGSNSSTLSSTNISEWEQEVTLAIQDANQKATAKELELAEANKALETVKATLQRVREERDHHKKTSRRRSLKIGELKGRLGEDLNDSDTEDLKKRHRREQREVHSRFKGTYLSEQRERQQDRRDYELLEQSLKEEKAEKQTFQGERDALKCKAAVKQQGAWDAQNGEGPYNDKAIWTYIIQHYAQNKSNKNYFSGFASYRFDLVETYKKAYRKNLPQQQLPPRYIAPNNSAKRKADRPDNNYNQPQTQGQPGFKKKKFTPVTL